MNASSREVSVQKGSGQRSEVSLYEHGRQIRDETQALAAAVRDTTDDLERYLTDQVRRRPYTTCGIAAAIGYTLGGGLGSRLTAALLGATTRFAMALAARELSARLWQAPSASGQQKSC